MSKRRSSYHTIADALLKIMTVPTLDDEVVKIVRIPAPTSANSTRNLRHRVAKYLSAMQNDMPDIFAHQNYIIEIEPNEANTIATVTLTAYTQ